MSHLLGAYPGIFLVGFLFFANVHLAESSCPDGWLTLPISSRTKTCILIPLSVSTSFHDGQNYCAYRDSYLYRDTGQTLHNALIPYIRRISLAGLTQSLYWIGLTDMNNDNGPWKWVGGSKVGSPDLGQYKNWVKTPPNYKGKEQCTYIYGKDPALKWRNSVDCKSKKGIICQRSFNAPKVELVCKMGWRFYDPENTCLKFVTTPRTWQSARDDCKRQKADLIRIPNFEMETHVITMISVMSSIYWIGLNDKAKEGTFKWLDDSDSAKYIPWAPNHPSKPGNTKDCCAIQPEGNWIEGDCNTKRRYICQAPAVFTKTSERPYVSRNCGPGWQEDIRSFNCFKFNTDRRSWLSALAQCKRLNGQLASITDVYQQSFLQGAAQTSSGSLFWTGGNDRNTEKGWAWSDNSTFAFFNWDKTPKNDQNKDCIALIKNTGRWVILSCSASYGYICKKPGKTRPSTLQPTTSPSATKKDTMWGCPKDWYPYRGSCYQARYTKSGITWNEAKDSCHALVSSLVTITDAYENKYVAAYLQSIKYYKSDMWIGLTDVNMENSFYWYDGTRMNYTIWQTGQPDNSGNEDCVKMSVITGKWVDYGCGSKSVKLFMCKTNKRIIDVHVPEDQKGCPKGVRGYENKCYGFYSTLLTFPAAQRRCLSMKGHLATLDERDVQNYLTSELTLYKGNYQYFWIGLHYTRTRYTWTSGSTNIDSTLWNKGHSGKERGCVGVATDRGWWYTFGCNKKLPFICEMPRQGYTTPLPLPTTTAITGKCPSDWMSSDKLCYKAVMSDAKTWPDALQYCTDLAPGGTLATIGSQDLSTRLKSFIGAGTEILTADGVKLFDDVWIGLNDRGAEGEYKWTDGAPFLWQNWNSSQPDDHQHRQDCVQWKLGRNYWFDANCFSAGFFICQMPKGSPLNTQPPTPSIGPSGGACGDSSWTMFNEMCYYVSPPDGEKAIVSWFDARDTCHKLNAHLVSITSNDENNYITSIIHSNLAIPFWIGLTDLSEFSYQWTDNTVYNYQSWQKGGPDNNGGGERCVQIDHNGIWDDINCQVALGYVCKKVPGGSPVHPHTSPTMFKGSCHGHFSSYPAVDRCYFVAGKDSAQQLGWEGATKECNKAWPNARLASLHNKIAAEYVTTLLAGVDGPVWIGLKADKKSHKFSWVDNQDVDYVNWGAKYSTIQADTPKQCIAIQGSPDYGEWMNDYCTEKHAYLCEYKRADDNKEIGKDTTGCQKGYVRFRNSCYKYVKSQYTWSHAQGICNAEGNKLMSVSDKYEAAVLDILMHEQKETVVWIGLSYSKDDSVYKWADGWPMTYTNWGSSNAARARGCVSYSTVPNVAWQDVVCSSTFSFICEKNLVKAPIKQHPADVSCPSGWTHFQGVCYYLDTKDKQSASGAQYNCHIFGGSLVSVHSQTESDFIAKWIKKAHVDVWIGLLKASDGKFYWSDQTEQEYIDNWATNEPSDPNSSKHQTCVIAQQADGKWNDTDCFDHHYYMCKKVVATPTASSLEKWPTTTDTDRHVTLIGFTLFPHDRDTSLGKGQQENSNGDSGMSAASVAGLVIGAVILVGLIIAGVFYVRRRFAGRPASPSTAAFDNVAYNSDKTSTNA